MTEQEKIEAVARALDPEIWNIDLPIPTRADVTSFHERRERSNTQAGAAIAALPAQEPASDVVERLVEALTEARDQLWLLAHDKLDNCWVRQCDQALALYHNSRSTE
jgi:hypothetical protein